MENKKDIGEAIKNSLKNYKVSPNKDIWNNIDIELKKEGKKSIWFFLWNNKNILFLLLIIFMGISIYFEITPKDKIINSKTLIKNTSIDKLINKKKKETVSDTISKDNNTKINFTNTKTVSDKKMLSNSKNQVNNQNKTKNISKKDTNIKYNIELSSLGSIEDSNKNELKHKIDYPKKSKDTSKVLIKRKKNTIKDLLKLDSQKKDTIKKKEKLQNKWSAFPNISLSNYGVNKILENSQLSYSYGLLFNYQATEDIALRLGVKNLNLRYSSKENLNTRQQEISYFEIPLEFKYTLINKKIKTSIIGGISYLILDKATLISTFQNNSNTITSNKNDFRKSTYSFNAGLNFQHQLYKRFYINIEPKISYLLKPNSNSVNLTPLSISIITGIEYKF